MTFFHLTGYTHFSSSYLDPNVLNLEWEGGKAQISIPVSYALVSGFIRPDGGSTLSLPGVVILIEKKED